MTVNALEIIRLEFCEWIRLPLFIFVFYSCAALQERDPNFYNMLTAELTPEQNKSLQDIIVLADQRKSAAESKKIEQAGGEPTCKFSLLFLNLL